MAFTKPAFFREIDPVDYQAEINSNFSNMDDAFA